MKYCLSHCRSERFKTREVMVGKVGVGGNNPIRIQSMTTSNTRDVLATVEQAMRLADAGCDIVRMTVQGMKEAEACEQIKNSLVQKGYDIPLVADIHFFPPAAMRVVESVDKVRINPGNFADKRATFKVLEYNEASYQAELDRIEEVFAPLIEKCKKLKKTLRIGTNHGSLSDRIMNYYGDAPQGMVESAFEYVRVCRKYDFHDIIFSMKASNPLVMIQAYRLIVAEMMKLGWDYPLHLGVTEAGLGEDGRVKSAIGIGSLLLDGIGDTIRISLTEDPWFEIDPCQRLVQIYEKSLDQGVPSFEEKQRNFLDLSRREVHHCENSLTHRDGSVFLWASKQQLDDPSFFQIIGCDIQFGRPVRKPGSIDAIIVSKEDEAHQKLRDLSKAGIGVVVEPVIIDGDDLVSWSNLLYRNNPKNWVFDKKGSRNSCLERETIVREQGSSEDKNCEVKPKPSETDSSGYFGILDPPPFALFVAQGSRLHKARRFFEWVKENAVKIPILLAFDYSLPEEDLVLLSAAECGSLLADGLGDGLALTTSLSLEATRSLSFNILQGVRMRASKTEYISCPGCGRTLFDLQEVTKRIKARTGHLPGVKIAVMGCTVNGPGEMADADFGYVGSKPGKIDLYVGKQCVERDIAFDDAEEKLVTLLKAHGRWEELEEPLCTATSLAIL